MGKIKNTDAGDGKHVDERDEMRADKGDGNMRRRYKLDENGKRVYYGNHILQIRDAAGKIKTFNLGTSDKRKAKDEARKILAALQNGDNSLADGRILVVDYIKNWMEEKIQDCKRLGKPCEASVTRYRNYLVIFVQFLQQCGHLRLAMKDVTPALFKEFQGWRRTTTRFGKKGGVHITPEGINRELKFLFTIFNAAYTDRLISKNPKKDYKKLDTDKKRIALPTKEGLEEIFRLVDDLTVMDYLTLIAATGLRAVEGQQLKFKHIDWNRQLITIKADPVSGWKPKNWHSVREVPVPDEVMEIFRRIMAQRGNAGPEDYLFVMADGSPLVEHKDHAYHRLGVACRKANRLRRKAGRPELPEITVRLLRHWHISWVVNRAENPLQDIQVIAYVGHANIEMIKKTYYHLDVDGHSGQKIHQTPLFGRVLSLAAAPTRQASAGASANAFGGYPAATDGKGTKGGVAVTAKSSATPDSEAPVV